MFFVQNIGRFLAAFRKRFRGNRRGSSYAVIPNTPGCQRPAGHDCEAGEFSKSVGWARNARSISQEIGVQVYHTGWPNFKEKNETTDGHT
jgi:hypothetical protein